MAQSRPELLLFAEKADNRSRRTVERMLEVLAVNPFRSNFLWAGSGKYKHQCNQDDCNRHNPFEVHGKEHEERRIEREG